MPEQETSACRVVQRFYDEWLRGDADALVALWADDAVMETVFSVAPVPPETAPPVMKGGEVIRAFWRTIVGVLKRRDLVDLWICGLTDPDWAIARFKGDMLTKDGRVYRNCYNNLICVQNGTIKEYYEYSNPLVILTAFVGDVQVTSR